MVESGLFGQLECESVNSEKPALESLNFQKLEALTDSTALNTDLQKKLRYLVEGLWSNAGLNLKKQGC